ncbi:phosphonate metabolism protein/1,5-bisphosphokinase (PRPP-forming) PhnN [Acidisoma silvae]|uniref:Ribose 1,5-bisphosphate phosphokinase PhnN n=1 Tax=Acidisoma silvae TaxID=2802396 RepID=A0A963YQU2_9PROT|nr:phosphonate metabolism protein/1,5-bisphosphokinase (PRPP-forming) PhnN [Acidisoma silvae]MCB8874959.1 phosphonate metabolism protein/1,5-bisphosphokinase (PRPP-forming) PhnN [Acidisoma silvae]
MTGRLVLIVGPSGSGKDTLLAGAAGALGDNPHFVFARRTVTREAAFEDHDTATVADFLARRAAGEFALFWEAHGLHYGIPHSAIGALTAGHIVVANVSRSVVRDAAERYPVSVIEITAPEAVRAARLADRRRESSAAIDARLARDMGMEGITPHRIVNDGTIAEGVAALARQFTALAAEALPELMRH